MASLSDNVMELKALASSFTFLINLFLFFWMIYNQAVFKNSCKLNDIYLVSYKTCAGEIERLTDRECWLSCAPQESLIMRSTHWSKSRWRRSARMGWEHWRKTEPSCETRGRWRSWKPNFTQMMTVRLLATVKIKH